MRSNRSSQTQGNNIKNRPGKNTNDDVILQHDVTQFQNYKFFSTNFFSVSPLDVYVSAPSPSGILAVVSNQINLWFSPSLLHVARSSSSFNWMESIILFWQLCLFSLHSTSSNRQNHHQHLHHQPHRNRRLQCKLLKLNLNYVREDEMCVQSSSMTFN